jgi:hypothetical protein
MTDTALVPNRMFMYAPGAGGHWLMHTLDRLMFNSNNALRAATDSYHKALIWPIHYDDHWIIRDNKDSLYLGDKCIFNFYVNYVDKLMTIEQIDQKDENSILDLYKIINYCIDWYDNFESIKNHPGFLSYTDLWSNPGRFSKQFDYAWRRAFGEGKHIKNYQPDKLHTSINEYKKSVVDPNKYYNQIDSKVWQAWCWYLIVRYNLIDEQTALLNIGLDDTQTELLYDLGFWNTNPDLFVAVINQLHKECLEITHDMIYFYPES